MASGIRTVNVLEFSKNNYYLSYSDPNGVLKIWDTLSGSLKQEYTPSSHLSVQCVCMAWGPSTSFHSSEQSLESPKKKRKKKETIKDSLEILQLLALGTTSGTILLYSVKQADLYTTLSGGHEKEVTGVCWSDDGSYLYSCSADEQIIQWDIEKSSIKHKWKSNQGRLCSITLCSSQEHLLVAGRSIQLWDLREGQVIQTFLGHTTEVLKIIEIPNLRKTSKKFVTNKSIEGEDGGGVEESNSREGGLNNGDEFSNIDGNYILSMATGESKISIRQIGGNMDRTSSLVSSFLLPDEPMHLSVSTPVHSKQPFQLAAVTKLGQLAYFECILNGKHKKPLKPKQLTTIVARSEKKERRLPIVVCSLSPPELNQGICLVYEDFIRPTFERISISDLKPELIRVDPRRKNKATIQDGVVKTRTPLVSKEVHLVGPGMTCPLPTVSKGGVVTDGNGNKGEDEDASLLNKSTGRKRKKSVVVEDELTLGDRLSTLNDTNSTSNVSAVKNKMKSPTTTMPTTTTTTTTTNTAQSSNKAESLALLLGQGLQSNDKLILNAVLQKPDPTFIKYTVSRLPSHNVNSLIRELSRRMTGHAQSAKTACKWMKAVLSLHSSYLTTLPDVDEVLNPIMHFLETPVDMLSKLMQLRGKLDCMVTQLSTRVDNQSTNQRTDVTPAICDINHDDDILIEDVRHNVVSEDDWDEELIATINSTTTPATDMTAAAASTSAATADTTPTTTSIAIPDTPSKKDKIKKTNERKSLKNKKSPGKKQKTSDYSEDDDADDDDVMLID